MMGINMPTSVFIIQVVTRKNIERIARFAFDYAVLNNRTKITAIHKANIQKLGDGLFLKVKVWVDGEKFYLSLSHRRYAMKLPIPNIRAKA